MYLGHEVIHHGLDTNASEASATFGDFNHLIVLVQDYIHTPLKCTFINFYLI